jgi:haloalkane dehalogenase
MNTDLDGNSFTSVPEWVDRAEYPFQPRRFDLPIGSMSYVDEGAGDPIVMVHGNPYWSFEYRKIIRAFSATHRCIAPDHIGFGLSDKPRTWSYLPEDHAANLAALLDFLDLEGVTLIVGDWGGPIGLSWAIDNPERVSSIVVNNTWLWPVDDDWYYRAFSGFVGGPIGRVLIRRRNFFATSVVKHAWGDRHLLTPEIRTHIETPLADPEDRLGTWVFPRRIIGSTTWIRSLWDRRDRLNGAVKLIAWGMKDIAFREKELNRWAETFPEARVVRYPNAGHFVPDEAAEDLISDMRRLFGDPVAGA